MDLQQQGYHQLTQQSLPQSSRETTETQLAELKKGAAGRTVLLVLDGEWCLSSPLLIFLFLRFICVSDMWESAHEKAFACIDEKTPSRLLVTTRIKGMLSQSTQVELELLSITESVELVWLLYRTASVVIPTLLFFPLACRSRRDGYFAAATDFGKYSAIVWTFAFMPQHR